MASLAHIILGKKPTSVAKTNATKDVKAPAINLIDKGTALGTIAILAIGALCTMLVYQLAADGQTRDSASLLQGSARIKAVNMRATFQQLQDAAFSLGANLENTASADASFDALATITVARQKGIVAAGWIPVVAKSESLTLARLQVAANSPLAEAAAKLVGTDFSTNPVWTNALALTRNTNAAQLVYANMGVGDAVVLQAVKERGADDRLKGYVILAISLPAIIDESLKSATVALAPTSFSERVLDITDTTKAKQIYPAAAVAEVTEFANSSRLAAPQLAPLAVFTRPWRVEITPNAEFSRERESGLLPFILLAGAGITALLVGGLLGTRRYAALVERKAEVKAAAFLDAKAEEKAEAMAEVMVSASVEEAKQFASMTQNAELAVLQQAYRSARETELQEMQSEKMASLGMMVAGVAHEINTPLGFVSSNIEMMLEINEKLSGVINTQTHLMRQIPLWGTLSQPARQAWFQVALDSGKALEEIKRREVMAEADSVVGESLEGLQRISDIVKSLKDFSRVDRAMVDAVDLHQCIDSTLLIAQNVVRGKADIIKNYGTIPTIQCNPSQINQVILNIVSNAAQAMDAHGQIVISTRSDGDGVVLEIADNGKGMSEDVRAQIFQPFFTTKDVGEGTGLGLAICDKIIRSHEGTISVQSMVGEGTTFAIRLPLKAKAAPQV
jgi:signal transduction histidine kinase